MFGFYCVSVYLVFVFALEKVDKMAKNVAKAVVQYETLLNDVLRERLR